MAANNIENTTTARIETFVKKANPASTATIATVQGINRMPRNAAMSEIPSKLDMSIQNIVLTLRKIKHASPLCDIQWTNPHKLRLHHGKIIPYG